MPPIARAKRFISPNRDAMRLAVSWSSMLHSFASSIKTGIVVMFVLLLYCCIPSTQPSFLNLYKKYRFITVLTAISTPKHMPYWIIKMAIVTTDHSFSFEQDFPSLSTSADGFSLFTLISFKAESRTQFFFYIAQFD